MIIEARNDVVSLEGSLDKNLWPTIQAAANLLLRHHTQGIIIDGSTLTGCSPEGAKTFRDAMDYIERYRARIVVAQLPESVMDVVKSVPGVRSRLPISDTIEAARASLHLARADGQKTRVHLAYFLEVPRQMPINAPLPEQESLARATLEAAEKWVRREGLTAVAHVARTRDAGDEIVHLAGVVHANIIILATAAEGEPCEDFLTRIAKVVLDRAPCEVILNKLPTTF
jgi:anti-anti-sigma regulatory factor